LPIYFGANPLEQSAEYGVTLDYYLYANGGAYAGLLLNNMSNVSIGSDRTTNLFQDLLNGIIAENTANMTVTRCRFVNMTERGLYPNEGYGILQRNNLAALHSLTEKGLGRDKVSGITFQNCARAGIAIDRTSVNIKQNYMESMPATGIQVRNAKRTFHTITDNTIFASSMGINTAFIAPIGTSTKVGVNIMNNEIWVDNVTAFTTGRGIQVSEAVADVNGLNKYNIRFNTVFINKGSVGIDITTVDGITIASNIVSLLNAIVGPLNPNRSAFLISGSKNAMISDNTANGVGPETGAITSGVNDFYPVGFRISATTNSTVQCNIANSTRTGMSFSGACDGTDVRGNRFNIHYRGLQFYTSGRLSASQPSIGQTNFPDRGNTWLQNGIASGGWGAIHIATLPVAQMTSSFGVNDQVLNSIYRPNPIPPAQWSTTQGGAWFSRSAGTTVTPCTPVLLATTTNGNDYTYLLSVATGLVQTEEYPYEAQQLAAKELYAILEEDTSQIPAGSDLETFYTQMQTTGIPEFKAVEEAIKTDLDPTTNSDKAVIASLYDLLDNYKIGLNAADSTIAALQADTLQNNTAAIAIAKTQHGILIQNFETTYAQLENLLQGISTLKDAQADAIKADNATLQDTEAWAYNQKQVQEIYLSTVAKESMQLDSIQKATLQSIAAQCPLSGGDAVYAARSLYAAIENVVYDDPQICWAQGISYRPSVPQSPKVSETVNLKDGTIKVYPNPAYNYLVVESNKATTNNQNRILITDIVGKIVYDSGYTSDSSNKWFISTQYYHSGMYILRLFDGENLLHTEKINIIK
jgi:hypothetical protein